MHTTPFSRVPTIFWWIVAACFLAFSWQRLAAQVSAVPADALPASLQSTLEKIDGTAQTAAVDIGRLRIEKWKADSGDKQQAESNAESIQRNLTAALPTLTNAVRTSPRDFGANFKLYRNLSALYDVTKTLTETAAAFGPKQDYHRLAPYTDALDQYRRSLGEYIDNLAMEKDAEFNRFRQQALAAQAEAAAPPKKVIIDDTQPLPRKKKKKTKHAASSSSAK